MTHCDSTTTHLFSASVDNYEEATGAKVTFARQQGIPIVGWQWLLKFGEEAKQSLAPVSVKSMSPSFLPRLAFKLTRSCPY